MLQYALALPGALLFGLGVELRPRGCSITYSITFGMLERSTALGKTLGFVGIGLWVVGIFLGPLRVVLWSLPVAAIVIGIGEMWRRQ